MSKKISEMDKTELIDFMRGNGEIHRGNVESKAWQRAFVLCSQEQGKRLDIDCSTCWRTVQDWIKK